MRILILNELAAPRRGEMNQYVLDVVQRLRRAGDEVALVHAREPKSELRGTGYIFNHLVKHNADDCEVKVRLDAIVQDFEPDIIQIHGVPNLRLDPMLMRHAPTVRWVHNHRFYCSGMNLTWQLPRRMCSRPHGKGCLAHHIANRCGSRNLVLNAIRYRDVSASLASLHHLSGIQVASAMMKENLIRNGFDPRRVEHLPLYAPPPTENAEATRRPLKRLILHPSGLVANKGVWLMSKSVADLPDDTEIVFGGTGPLESQVERYVKAQGLSERIRLPGELTPAQWSRLYHQASLVVMPSMWNEPLGLSGMHAMAHGKPVVAFSSDGISEWLQDGVTGVAVPFGRRKLFVQCVRQLLAEPARMAAMGRAAQDYWKVRFQPSHHIELLREYYAHIIRNSHSTPRT